MHRSAAGGGFSPSAYLLIPSKSRSGSLHQRPDIDIADGCFAGGRRDRYRPHLGYICQHLEAYQPASLKICTLLDNPAERLLTIKIDYRCFEMPDTFLIGYGLDYREKYRNLPYIAEFKK